MQIKSIAIKIGWWILAILFMVLVTGVWVFFVGGIHDACGPDYHNGNYSCQ